MKNFFLRHKKLHLWLLADLVLLVLFALLRGSRAAMNGFVSNFSTPIRRFIGKLCYRVDFSVAELLCVLLVLAVIAYVIWSVAAVARAEKEKRGRRAYTAVLGAACGALTLGAVFCWFWGADYYTDSFQEQSGICAQPVAAEDLLRVTLYFAQQTALTAGSVDRDENGVFAVPREKILAESPYAYDALEEQFPFLTFGDLGVKPIRLSRVMSALDFTGVYCPYTGESNVNMDSPACMLPATAAHEMAHQRGYASEQECNFLGILAATTCGNDAYVYSGWLLGYIYLGNALYRVAPDTYWAIRRALPETVEADLAENSAYWDQFRDTAAQKVSNKVYDGMLKAYGQEQGIQSYGTVVDMLVVYYRDMVKN